MSVGPIPPILPSGDVPADLNVTLNQIQSDVGLTQFVSALSSAQTLPSITSITLPTGPQLTPPDASGNQTQPAEVSALWLMMMLLAQISNSQSVVQSKTTLATADFIVQTAQAGIMSAQQGYESDLAQAAVTQNQAVSMIVQGAFNIAIGLATAGVAIGSAAATAATKTAEAGASGTTTATGAAGTGGTTTTATTGGTAAANASQTGTVPPSMLQKLWTAFKNSWSPTRDNITNWSNAIITATKGIESFTEATFKSKEAAQQIIGAEQKLASNYSQVIQQMANSIVQAYEGLEKQTGEKISSTLQIAQQMRDAQRTNLFQG